MNEKTPFKNLRSEYYDHAHKKDNQTQETFFSLNPDRIAKPQLFSYFFHDMEKEEKEHIMPKK